jgi:voltage-gated potassium channel
MTRRRRMFILLEPTAWPRIGLSPLNRIITALICMSVLLAIVESEQELAQTWQLGFLVAERIFFLLFFVEYCCRLWVAAENPRYGAGWRGRLRYAVSPAALLDLVALLPIFIAFLGSEAFLFRLVRLVRILRLAKLGRYSTALDAIGTAIRSRRYELAMSVKIAGILLLISSALLYIVEGDGQPETFGSIPRAMWWSIATLTTVGYGDAVPITTLGRLLAGLTAILGIGLIAMPTGILAAAFSDAMQKRGDPEPRDPDAREKSDGT